MMRLTAARSLCQTHPVGKSDGRATKFKVGFYRRPAAAIQQDAERLAYEEARSASAAAIAAARTEQLRAINQRNGNVLCPTAGGADSGSGGAGGGVGASAVEQPLFDRRRHFPSYNADVEATNHARQKIGASRFHVEATAREVEARARLVTARLQQQQQQTTSVLGYGRSDLPCGGVVDNFRPAPYTGEDLLSKPKLRPPPAGSVAARRALGQVSLEDGSGSVGFGRRGDPAGVNIATPAAAGVNSSRIGTAHARDAPPAMSGRRSNRGNTTSSELRDAFNYNSVSVWNNRNNAAQSPPAAASAPASTPA